LHSINLVFSELTLFSLENHLSESPNVIYE